MCIRDSFPRPPPPIKHQSDSESSTSKENRSPRRRLRRDLLPSDSDVSEPPTPQKPASDFFRRAARRAYAPAKEDPRLQLRRALVDALLKCADATSAAQLVRNDGPAALNCERAELWVAKASTNEEHWSCDDDKALAAARDAKAALDAAGVPLREPTVEGPIADDAFLVAPNSYKDRRGGDVILGKKGDLKPSPPGVVRPAEHQRRRKPNGG